MFNLTNMLLFIKFDKKLMLFIFALALGNFICKLSARPSVRLYVSPSIDSINKSRLAH